MLPLEHPDRIQIAFDETRLVNNAGLLFPATLALHLGLSQLVKEHLDLGDAPGRANTGDKMLTLVSRVNHYCRFGVNQFCRFTSSAWPRCWATSVR